MSYISRKTSYAIGVFCVIGIIICLYFAKDGMDPVSRGITEFLFTPLWLLTGYFALRFVILHLSDIWVFHLLDRLLSAIVNGCVELLALFFAPRRYRGRDDDYDDDFDDDNEEFETYYEYPSQRYPSQRRQYQQPSAPRGRRLDIYGDRKGGETDIWGNRRGEYQDIWGRRYKR